MNQFAATRVDPAVVNAEELSKLIMARDRRSRDMSSRRRFAASGDPGFSAESYLGDELRSPTAGDLEPLVDQVLAANPGSGRVVPQR